MKRCLTSVSFALFFLYAFSAQAANHYMELNLGYNMLDDIHYAVETDNGLKYDGVADLDDGHFFSGVLGYEHGPYRFAGELSYVENTVNSAYVQWELAKFGSDFDGHVNALSAMFNLFYDFEMFELTSPYLGIGLGSSNVEIDGWDETGYFFNDSTSVFSYQCTVGLLVHLSERVDINLGYRYFNTNDFTLQRTIRGIKYRYEMKYETNILLAGLKFSY